jgi:hypothetical protein
MLAEQTRSHLDQLRSSGRAELVAAITRRGGCVEESSTGLVAPCAFGQATGLRSGGSPRPGMLTAR